MVPEPFNPQSLNRYSYCLNNPLIYTDPSGHAINSPENPIEMEDVVVTAEPIDDEGEGNDHGGEVLIASAGTMTVPGGLPIFIVKTEEQLKADKKIADGIWGSYLIPINQWGMTLAFIVKMLEEEEEAKEDLEVTPETAKEQFENVKGKPGKRNKKTEEIFEKDKLHKDHYEVYKNKRDYEKGKRNRSVWSDGRLKEKV